MRRALPGHGGWRSVRWLALAVQAPHEGRQSLPLRAQQSGVERGVPLRYECPLALLHGRPPVVPDEAPSLLLLAVELQRRAISVTSRVTA